MASSSILRRVSLRFRSRNPISAQEASHPEGNGDVTAAPTAGFSCESLEFPCTEDKFTPRATLRQPIERVIFATVAEQSGL